MIAPRKLPPVFVANGCLPKNCTSDFLACHSGHGGDKLSANTTANSRQIDVLKNTTVWPAWMKVIRDWLWINKGSCRLRNERTPVLTGVVRKRTPKHAVCFIYIVHLSKRAHVDFCRWICIRTSQFDRGILQYSILFTALGEYCALRWNIIPGDWRARKTNNFFSGRN